MKKRVKLAMEAPADGTESQSSHIRTDDAVGSHL